jgi:hypothetical protein
MKIVAVLLGCALSVGCLVEAGEGELGPEGEVLETSSEELKGGAYYGGGGLVFGTNPYGDCLTNCSNEKRACEESRGPYDDLMAPCDLYYSMCKADCDRGFPP